MLTDIERIYSSLLDTHYPEKLFGDLPGFEKKDSGYIARCPFHEDSHPTMVIYDDRPEYFCFACSARGDWLKYMQLKDGISFYDALDKLSNASGILSPDYDKERWFTDLSRTIILEQALGYFNAQLFARPGEEVLHYLYKRGYTMSEVEGSSLGYYPGYMPMRDYLISQGFSSEELDETLAAIWNTNAENCGLVIPYRDSSGRLMGLYGRDIALSGQEAYAPLTDMSMLEDVPFLMYRSRGAEELIVVAGLLDALLIDRIAIKPVVGIGKSGLSTYHLNALCTYGIQHCIICLGSSARQKRATHEAIESVSARGIGVSVMPLEDSFSDIDEFIRSNDLNRFRKLLAHPQDAKTWAEENRI